MPPSSGSPGTRPTEAVGRSLALLRFEANDEETLARLHTALEAGEAFAGVLLSQRRDGSPYWSETEVQPLRDASGALSGFIVIESDISERKIAEGARQRWKPICGRRTNCSRASSRTCHAR